MITLEVKFESNINGVIEEIAECGNVDTADIWRILDTQPKQFGKEHIKNEKSSFYKKDENILKEVAPAY